MTEKESRRGIWQLFSIRKRAANLLCLLIVIFDFFMLYPFVSFSLCSLKYNLSSLCAKGQCFYLAVIFVSRMRRRLRHRRTLKLSHRLCKDIQKPKILKSAMTIFVFIYRNKTLAVLSAPTSNVVFNEKITCFVVCVPKKLQLPIHFLLVGRNK